MNNIKIFVSHRREQDCEIVNHLLYVPVRCGAIFGSQKNTTMPGDHTGENISDKWMSYGDLTVLYWAWKNVEADFYGFCNYQRYFAFPLEKQSEDCYGNICCEYWNEKEIDILGLNATGRICEKVSPYEIIVTVPMDVRNGDKRFKNLFQYYDFIRGKHAEDLEQVLYILDTHFPEYSEDARNYLNGHDFYPYNLFIMNRELLPVYCNWLFKVLSEFEKNIISEYDSMEDSRSVHQVGELLMGVFYTHLKRIKPELKTQVLQRLLIQDTRYTLPPIPYFTEKNIPVVLASSELFLPYTGVTIQSIIEHSSQDYNYDIILLNTGYSDQAIQLLHRIAADYPNFSIRLLNVGPYVSKLKFNVVGHVSQETFYRLLVPELFRNYKKIVYLDSDLIVCEDIVNLFCIDMQDNLIAAVYDADFIGGYNGASQAIKTYADEKLCLEDPYSYVQAGVLVFNVSAMKNTFKENELIEFASGKTLNFADQDVLNCKCSGRIQLLDMRWNVVTDCGGYRVNQLIRRAPLRIYQEYVRSRDEPKIIHYSGFEKPWANPYSDMAEIFWNYARKSVFYELIIYRMIHNEVHGSSNQTLVTRLKNIGRRIVDLCLPKNTQRREDIRKIYYILFRHA